MIGLVATAGGGASGCISHFGAALLRALPVADDKTAAGAEESSPYRCRRRCPRPQCVRGVLAVSGCVQVAFNFRLNLRRSMQNIVRRCDT